jgi:hypothetical protein
MKKINIGQSIYIVRRGKQPSIVFSNAAKMCRQMADRPDFPNYEKVSNALQATRKGLVAKAAEAALRRAAEADVPEVDTEQFDLVFTLWRIEVRQVL